MNNVVELKGKRFVQAAAAKPLQIKGDIRITERFETCHEVRFQMFREHAAHIGRRQFDPR